MKRVVWLSAVLMLAAGVATDALAQSSPAVEKLTKDQATLSATVATAITVAKSLDGKVTYVRGKLDIPGKISSDLKKLDTALKTAKALLTVAADVPDIRSEVQVMVDGVTAIDKPVADGQKFAGDFDNRIKPAKDAASALHNRLNSLIGGAEEFQKDLAAYAQHVATVQSCLSKAPAGSAKTSAQQTLDQAVTRSDQAVVAVNTALSTVIADVNKLAKAIDDGIEPLMKPVDVVNDGVEALQGALEKIEDPLREVGKVLAKSFSVTFPYPHPTWSNPFDIRHYTLKMSLNTLLKDVSTIEKEIEKALSSALYKFAKVFGLEKLIKSLVDDAKKALSAVLSALHLNFKIDVPGLGALQNTLASLEKTGGALLSSAKINVDPAEAAVKKLHDELATALDKLQVCAAKPATPTAPAAATPRRNTPLTVAKPETQLIWTAK